MWPGLPGPRLLPVRRRQPPGQELMRHTEPPAMLGPPPREGVGSFPGIARPNRALHGEDTSRPAPQGTPTRQAAPKDGPHPPAELMTVVTRPEPASSQDPGKVPNVRVGVQ